MSKMISQKPAILASQISQMISGLQKYSADFAPVGPTAEELTTTLAALNEAMVLQQQAMGAAESATQKMYSTRDAAIKYARRMRDSIYAFYGKTDTRIVEFGLDTLKYGKTTKTADNSSDGDTSET